MSSRQKTGSARRFKSYEIFFADAFAFAAILPIIPFLDFAARVTPIEAGLIVAIHPLVAIFSAPLIGAFSDKIGRLRTIRITLFFTAIAYLIFAFSESVDQVFVSRFVAGLAAGNISVANAMISDIEDAANRKRVFSHAISASAAGFVLGPAVTLVISQGYGGQIQLGTGIAAAFALTVCLSLQLLKNETREISLNIDRNATPRADPPVGYHNLRQLIPILLALAFLVVAQSGLMAVIGYWVEFNFNWKETSTSLLFLSIAFTVILMQSAIAPSLFKSKQPKWILCSCLILACASSLGLSLTPPSPLFATIMACVLMASIAQSQSAVNAIVASNASPNARGTTMGAVTSAGAIGRVTGPIGLGFVANLSPILLLPAATLALFISLFCIVFIFNIKNI